MAEHLIGWTPNFSSFNIHVLRGKDPVVSPPSHLLYFTPQTIDNLLERNGFQRVALLNARACGARLLPSGKGHRILL